MQFVNVSQVPPPVTPWELPPLAGAWNVPLPVSLIFRLASANATATPPGLSVVGPLAGKLMLMMSQRTKLAWPYTTGRPAIIDNSTASDTTAVTKIHFLTIGTVRAEHGTEWGRSGDQPRE